MRRLTLAALAASATLAAFTTLACGSDDPPTTTAVRPAAQDTQRWVKNWCIIQPGDPRAFARVLMGKPTGDYTEQDQWEAFGYSFTAFYDERDRATQLQLSAVRMTKRQRRAIHCNEVRS